MNIPFLSIDMNKSKFSNAPVAFRERDSQYSPKFDGSPESYLTTMQNNRETYINLPSSELSSFNPREANLAQSIHTINYNKQRHKWQSLDNAIKQHESGNLKQAYKILGYDLETLGVQSATTPGNTASITEFGITETILNPGQKINHANSYSVAMGVHKDELAEYINMINVVNSKGFNAYTGTERSMVSSTLERASRYAGNIEEVFTSQNISALNRDNVTVIKKLSDSSRYNSTQIIDGTINLAILQGTNLDDIASQFQNIEDAPLRKQALATLSHRYDEFQSLGLAHQQFKTDGGVSQLFQDMTNLIKQTSESNNASVVGFNINSFDNNILNAYSYNKINSSNVIDIYSGLQHANMGNDLIMADNIKKYHGFTSTVINKPSTQEGIAQIIGISFEDVAHNAGSDSKVENEIITHKDFYKGMSVFEYIENASSNQSTPNTINILDEDTVFYSLSSVPFSKNKGDFLEKNGEIANRYHMTGLTKGNYYKVNSIKPYEDGRVGVNYTSVAGGTYESFVKMYDSEDDLITGMKQFVFETTNIDKSNPSLPYIDNYTINRQRILSDADKARRNYDDLFQVSSIEQRIIHNNNTYEYQGGYDKLQQYFNAYKQVSFDKDGIYRQEISESSGEFIQDIADTAKYDEEIINALIDSGLGYNKDGKDIVSDSIVRDFKNFYGKLYDEEEMLDFISNKLDGEEFSIHQKTLFANHMRNEILSDINSTKGLIPMSDAHAYSREYSSRADMYSLDFSIESKKHGESLVSINLENKEDAVNKLTKAYYQQASINDTGDNTAEVVRLIKKTVKTIEDENQFITEDVSASLQKVLNNPISATQPRRIVEQIVSVLHDDYVKPIKETGFNYVDYINEDYSKVPNNETRYFLENKSVRSSGANIHKARGSLLVDKDGTVQSVSSLFDSNKYEFTANKTLETIKNTNYSLEKSMNDGTIQGILSDKLGYDEENIRMITQSLSGTTKSGQPYGFMNLNTVSGKDSTDYITKFYHTGIKGDDACLFINKSDDIRNEAIVANALIGADASNFKEVIEELKENSNALIMRLPAINSNDEFLDINKELYNDDFFQLVTGFTKDGEEILGNYGFKTITQGDKGFQRISQSKIAMYDNNAGYGLENLDLTISDDLVDVNKSVVTTKRKITETLQDESMSLKDRYASATSQFSRAQNRALKDMPGLSGAQPIAEVINGVVVYKKINKPNTLDVMQSSAIEIEALQRLVLETAREDIMAYEAGHPVSQYNIDMANYIATFGRNKDPIKGLENMIDSFSRDSTSSLSPQFQEMFLKHFNVAGVEYAQGEYAAKNATGTMLDYMFDSVDRYSPKTQNTVKMLYANRDKMSQITKSSATNKMKVSLFRTTVFNPGESLDATLRPPASAQQAAIDYNRNLVKQQIGENRLNEFEITLGHDAPILQRVERNMAMKNIKIDGTNLTHGDLEEGFSLNIRQIDGAEALSKVIEADTNFAQVFKDDLNIANAIAGFGLTKDEHEHYIRQALETIKPLHNTYEGNMSIRPSIAYNDMFTKPNIKPTTINKVMPSSLQEEMMNNDVKEFLRTRKLVPGSNYGRAVGDTDVSAIYNGPSGTIVGDPMEFLLTGKGQMIETAEGMTDFKGYIGNEKFTGAVLKKDEYIRRFNPKKNGNKVATDLANHYTDLVYSRLFGDKVGGVAHMPINKHMLGNNLWGSYVQSIMYEANKNPEKHFGSVVDLFDAAANSLGRENYKGINILMYDGQITLDSTGLEKAGIFGQIEKAVDIILNKNQEERSSNRLWNNIQKRLLENEEFNIARATITRGLNSESQGGAAFIDMKMGTALASQFKEDLTEYSSDINDWSSFNSVDVDGKKVPLSEFIINEIRAESVDGYADTSATPISKNFASEMASRKSTVEGMLLSLQNLDNPDAIINAPNVLNLDLKDMVYSKPGSDPTQMLESGYFKVIESNGKVKFSKQTTRAAKDQGKNLNDLTAIKVSLNLNDSGGIGFDIGDNKNIQELIIPIYDITPFRGEIQYTTSMRKANEVIKLAKDYASGGLLNNKKDLQEAVNMFRIQLGKDLETSKGSYVYNKIFRIPMKNSGMMFAQGTSVPTVGEIVNSANSYNDWLSVTKNNPDRYANMTVKQLKDIDIDYRNNIIENVKYGKVGSMNLELGEAAITGKRYSHISNGKVVYDNIIEMSKEGFISKGLDFEKSGLDLVYNTDSYKFMVDGLEFDEFFNIDRLGTIKEKLKSEKLIEAIDNPKRVAKLLSQYSNDAGTFTIEESMDVLMLKNYFESVTEDYLENVGTIGLAGRHPVFSEGGMRATIVRLNNRLSRDDVTVTPALGKILNMDHDGDTGFAKHFFKGGKLLSSRGRGRFKFAALNKMYEESIAGNNAIMADLIQAQADFITQTGIAVDRLSDIGNKNAQFKSTILMTLLPEEQRKNIINKLGLSDYADLNLKELDYINNKNHIDAVNKIFDKWDSLEGNMIKNAKQLAASIKVRYTQEQIGFISNINYAVNQSLSVAMDEALANNNISDINMLRSIKKNLHIGNKGLLPEIEQSSLDVKHVVDGLNIAETSEWLYGVKNLFKATPGRSGYKNRRKALEQIYAVVGPKLMKEEKTMENMELFINNVLGSDINTDELSSVEKQIRSLVTLTTNSKTARDDFNYNIKTNIDSLETLQEFLDKLDKMAEIRSNLSSKAHTPQGIIIDALEKAKDVVNLGYKDKNGIFQNFEKDAVYLSSQVAHDGSYEPMAFLLRDIEYADNGTMSLKFGASSIVTDKRFSYEINGTVDYVNKKAKRLFQNNKKYSVAEFRNTEDFQEKIAEDVISDNLERYADLTIKNIYNEDLADSQTSFIKRLKETGFEYDEVVDHINRYSKEVNVDSFIDFRDKIRYIKSNKAFVKPNVNIDTALQEGLEQINKSLIARSKNRTASTSVEYIFDGVIQSIATETAISDFGTSKYINFVNNYNNVTLDNIFENFDRDRININKATSELNEQIFSIRSDPKASDIIENVKEILEEYSNRNQKLTDNARNLVNKYADSSGALNQVFNWKSNNIDSYRVGVSNHFGKMFSELTEQEIKEVMSYKVKGNNALYQYAEDATKKHLTSYMHKNKKAIANEIAQGAEPQHIEAVKNNVLKHINEETIAKGSDTINEGMAKKGAKTAADTAQGMTKKTLGESAESVGKKGSTAGKVLLGIAALGIASNVFDRVKKSPLSRKKDNEEKEDIGVQSSGQQQTIAPKSNKKTVYVNEKSSGLQYKISAKAGQIMSEDQVAKHVSNQVGGNTSINIYDDRSQVSHNWLERKFTEMI